MAGWPFDGLGQARGTISLALRFRCFEAFAALFAVAVQGVEDDGIGFGWGANLVDFDGLAFELFVVLEKTAEHEQAVWGHLGGLVIRVELGVLGSDGDDFVVGLALIDHRHQSDCTRMDDGERYDCFLTEHEHVERIVILGVRLGNEPVVCRVIDGRVEDTVEADETAGLVEFVLHAGAEGNFDNAVELVGKLVAGSYVVPGMNHRMFRMDASILTDGVSRI